MEPVTALPGANVHTAPVALNVQLGTGGGFGMTGWMPHGGESSEQPIVEKSIPAGAPAPRSLRPLLDSVAVIGIVLPWVAVGDEPPQAHRRRGAASTSAETGIIFMREASPRRARPVKEMGGC